MPGPIAICPDHGSIQDSSGIYIGDGARDIEIIGGSTTCWCGRPAEYVDGVYSNLAGTLTGVLRPTPAQAIRLRNAMDWAQRKVTEAPDTAPEAAARLEKTLRAQIPAAAPILDRLTSQRSMGALAYLSFLVTLITLFLTGNAGVSEADIARIVETTILEHDRVERGQEITDLDKRSATEEVESPPSSE